MKWLCKKFDELDVAELYDILKIRNDVFVLEQQCVYQDADDKDKNALHLFTYSNKTIAAYARLLPPGISYKEASIGRVLSSPSQRKNGFGILLMRKAIAQTKKIYHTKKIRIGAQLYLKLFYESFGFVQMGEVYDEDGIPHIEMLLS